MQLVVVQFHSKFTDPPPSGGVGGGFYFIVHDTCHTEYVFLMLLIVAADSYGQRKHKSFFHPTITVNKNCSFLLSSLEQNAKHPSRKFYYKYIHKISERWFHLRVHKIHSVGVQIKSFKDFVG